MSLTEGSQERQSECAHLLYKGQHSRVGSNFGLGIWSVSTYHMSMYASANSCVDRLNTESGRDPASRLTQRGANKRRE